jgi:hypothetical protein
MSKAVNEWLVVHIVHVRGLVCHCMRHPIRLLMRHPWASRAQTRTVP